MEWSEEGFVTGTRAHGEGSVILEAFTRDRGRVGGYVRGGRSKRMRPFLQVGNTLDLRWRARTEDRLGSFTVDLVSDRRLAFETRDVVLGLLTAAGHVRLLPERQPVPALHDAFSAMLGNAHDRHSTLNLLLGFEMAVLSASGYALDLTRCAATGSEEDLAYVSPRSGRAVSREAGEPWKDDLLPLPAFMREGRLEDDEGELARGFVTTGRMLAATLYAQGADRPLPLAREQLLNPVAASARLS